MIIDEKFNGKFCEVYRKGEADSCRSLASSHNPETIRFSREVEKPPSSGKISNAGCSFLAKSNSPIDGGRPLRGGGGSIVTLESWRGKENNDRKNKGINGVVKSEMGSRVTTIQLKPIPYYRCLLASISSCFPSLISLLDYVPSAGGTGFVKLIGGLKSNPEISRSIFYGSIFLVAIVFREYILN